MSWRPEEGWNNPHEPVAGASTTAILIKAFEHTAYEAGADAMLEALKKQGKYLEAGKMPMFTYPVSGHLVFIPDEEVKHGFKGML